MHAPFNLLLLCRHCELQAWQQTSASPQGQQRMQMDAGEHGDGDDEATNPQLVFTRMTPCLLPELAQVSQGIMRL